MKNFIYLKTLDEVNAFVSEANKVDGDVICHRGIFCVDGKSYLGVLSLTPSEGISVEYPDDSNFAEYVTAMMEYHKADD